MDIRYTISGFADEISNDLNVQIAELKRLGIGYVEMRGVDGASLVAHTDDKVKEIKKRLDDAGIRLSSVGSPFGKIGIDEPFEKHLEDFKRGVEIAHIMDCKNIRMFSFYIPENNGTPELARYEGEVFSRLESFVSVAEKEDVVLLHENEKGIYGAMAKECRKLMDTFYGEHFKAVFDFANFVQVGQDTEEAYELLKDFVAYIHVKDALAKDGSVVPAGLGDGNVADILRKLFERGYDGFLSLEPHLAEFTFFSLLEKHGFGSADAQKKKALSGTEAFEIAYNALNEILKSL